jgi:hypothetical protein
MDVESFLWQHEGRLHPDIAADVKELQLHPYLHLFNAPALLGLDSPASVERLPEALKLARGLTPQLDPTYLIVSALEAACDSPVRVGRDAGELIETIFWQVLPARSRRAHPHYEGETDYFYRAIRPDSPFSPAASPGIHPTLHHVPGQRAPIRVYLRPGIDPLTIRREESLGNTQIHSIMRRVRPPVNGEKRPLPFWEVLLHFDLLAAYAHRRFAPISRASLLPSPALPTGGDMASLRDFLVFRRAAA